MNREFICVTGYVQHFLLVSICSQLIHVAVFGGWSAGDDGDGALPSCSFPTMTLKCIHELQVLQFKYLRASAVTMHKFMPLTPTQSATTCVLTGSDRQRWRVQLKLNSYGETFYHWPGTRRQSWASQISCGQDLKFEGDLLAHVAHNSEGHVMEKQWACRPRRKWECIGARSSFKGRCSCGASGVCIASPRGPCKQRYYQRAEDTFWKKFWIWTGSGYVVVESRSADLVTG